MSSSSHNQPSFTLSQVSFRAISFFMFSFTLSFRPEVAISRSSFPATIRCDSIETFPIRNLQPCVPYFPVSSCMSVVQSIVQVLKAVLFPPLLLYLLFHQYDSRQIAKNRLANKGVQLYSLHFSALLLACSEKISHLCN